MTIRPLRIRKVFWPLFVLALLGLIFWLGQLAAYNEAQTQLDSLHRSIEIHTLALRGAAAKYNYLPFTAARHPEVIAALVSPLDPETKRKANHYLEEINRSAGSDALYVMNREGNTLVSSNWNTAQSFVGQDYANRPYTSDALEGRRSQFYGVGKTTGEPGLFMSAPVRRNGAVIGVVAVKVSLRAIQETWSNADAPIMLADAKGVFFLGSEPSWMYRAAKALSSDDLEWIRSHDVYGLYRTFPVIPWAVRQMQDQLGYELKTSINGHPRRFLAVDELLPELGWTLTVTTDYAVVTYARNRAWMLACMGAGLLMLLGLYLQLRERRFVEQRDARRELEVSVRQRTQELGQAHAFRKAMEDSLLVGMRARDLEGRIIYVNPALCEMTGYSVDELVGRLPPYPYWHPDDMEKHWRDNDAALSGQAAATGYESRIRHRDGHDVYSMVYMAPLIDVTGKHFGWMSSVVDISAQKRAETREREQTEQLQHAQRLASLGEMASTLAHELNQPLMALGSFASAAKRFEELGNQAMLVSSLNEITAQTQRAAEIVQWIRGFVRPRTQGAEQCQLQEIVNNALALLNAEIRRHRIKIIVRIDASLPLVSGDRVLLEQLVLNLVLNSVHAMQNTVPHLREIEIAARQVEAVVVVTISDRGPGIAADLADKVFDTFFTTKADGLGLGLNICRTIVERHGGQLNFHNRADGGVVFTFQLKGAA
ncbi:PAS domain S-box protein [Herbaspirillum sp. RTI4]|uniref:PAS domain S-box protein n=1 Tax=Herbaspirillum sp. RTI4 TaxID=3048640 RepID=UPI002AB49E8E|nr:PAS domain S-box protein [Herbaspirillum sp. RTI4]MDY7578273.1 PAS domain S-box protein [Herbaspirillum sp. RTI4]MEA9981234.1 PAS domain S-box protein [Herbaspirillum sp. RTI4]